MAILALGNANPREWILDDPATGDGHYQSFPLPSGSTYTITKVEVPAGFGNLEVAQTVALPGGIWERHSSDTAPLWVGSDDASLATVVGALLGVTVDPWATVQTLAAAIGFVL